VVGEDRALLVVIMAAVEVAALLLPVIIVVQAVAVEVQAFHILQV
jgi:hypothetical protein